MNEEETERGSPTATKTSRSEEMSRDAPHIRTQVSQLATIDIRKFKDAHLVVSRLAISRRAVVILEAAHRSRPDAQSNPSSLWNQWWETIVPEF